MNCTFTLKLILLLSGIAVSGLSILRAQTYVSGSVAGNWYPAASPYVVTGHVIVLKDSSLVIAPGVQVLFDGYHKFVVNGLLHAAGTRADSILFLPLHPNTTWRGIRFVDADSRSRLEYCRIEYGRAFGEDLEGAGGGIFCQNSSITISHNTIRHNSSSLNRPVWCGGGICGINSSPRIEYNVISNNLGQGGAGGGIFFIDSSPIISYNLIDSNKSQVATTYTPSGGGIYLEKSTALKNWNLVKAKTILIWILASWMWRKTTSTCFLIRLVSTPVIRCLLTCRSQAIAECASISVSTAIRPKQRHPFRCYPPASQR
jgi:hypothetical protein